MQIRSGAGMEPSREWLLSIADDILPVPGLCGVATIVAADPVFAVAVAPATKPTETAKSQEFFKICAVPTVQRESPMLLPVIDSAFGVMTVREASTAAGVTRGCVPTQVGRSMRGVRLRWALELLMSFQQIAVGAPADAGRPAPDRKIHVKYDGDILHIIKQYPGCHDARILAFVRARVHWIGRGTLIHKVFRPSLSTVHAAARRLEIAGKITTKVDHAQPHAIRRFYPTNPLWTEADAET